MEYRIFREIDENKFHSSWTKERHIKKRTDIYFLLSSTKTDENPLLPIERGLKLRDEKTLELKTRVKRYENGQEYWIKNVKRTRSFDIDEIEEIRNLVRRWNENEVADFLERSPPEIVCRVKKYLKGKKSHEGGMLESTGFSLRFQRRADREPIGKKLYFETLCFEYSSSKEIDDEILRKAFSIENLVTENAMGYPEFILRQYKKMNSSTETF